MLPLFFRVKIRKGAIQMLKKIISAMLALTLALSLAGVVCASGGPEQGIERVQVLEEAVPAGTVPMAQASGNYFIPYDWTYGQSVVVGQSMFLRVAVNDVGLTGGYQVVVIYQGTYESIDEEDEPVSSGVFACKGTSAVTDFEWKTTGLKPGDYTALFLLVNQNEKNEEPVVFKTYADLYLSDREIPLEGIDLYVHELETEGSPERIATGLGAQFSVGVRYRPYHTTADRSYTVTSLNNSFQGDFSQGFAPGTWGFQSPGASADTILTAACGNQTDTLTVYARTFETGVVLVTDHKVDPDRLEVLQAPTATKDGWGTGKCLYCGETVETTISRIFTDTSSQTYYSDAVDDCYARGVIKGITEHQFGPNQNLTRGMLVTMLYRYAGSPEMTGETSFSDVREGRYFYQAVVWAEENQIANGYPDGTFQPNQNITREQMVTMLFRCWQSEGNTWKTDVAALNAYKDSAKVSSWALPAMRWAAANGVVNGVGDSMLEPQGQATRAQFAKIIMVYLENLA